MTGLLFQEWLSWFDRRMAGRRVLLVVDNAPSHSLGGIPLEHTQLLFLPPRTTSLAQPLDAGIIAAFKLRYRRLQMMHAMELYEEGANDYYQVTDCQFFSLNAAIMPASKGWTSDVVLGGRKNS